MIIGIEKKEQGSAFPEAGPPSRQERRNGGRIAGKPHTPAEDKEVLFFLWEREGFPRHPAGASPLLPARFVRLPVISFLFLTPKMGLRS